MKFSTVLTVTGFAVTASCAYANREPLSYAPIPEGTYVAPKNASTTTLLDFVKSKPELSTLAGILKEAGGMLSSKPPWFNRLESVVLITEH